MLMAHRLGEAFFALLPANSFPVGGAIPAPHAASKCKLGNWCPGWGSNPQAFRRLILSQLRLPIPPPGQGRGRKGKADGARCKSQSRRFFVTSCLRLALPSPRRRTGRDLFPGNFECFRLHPVYLCVISCLLGCLVCWQRRPSGWFPGGRLSSF